MYIHTRVVHVCVCIYKYTDLFTYKISSEEYLAYLDVLSTLRA